MLVMTTLCIIYFFANLRVVGYVACILPHIWTWKGTVCSIIVAYHLLTNNLITNFWYPYLFF